MAYKHETNMARIARRAERTGDSAKVMQQMVELHLAGYSPGAIAKALTRMGHKPFGRASYWHDFQVSRILGEIDGFHFSTHRNNHLQSDAIRRNAIGILKSVGQSVNWHHKSKEPPIAEKLSAKFKNESQRAHKQIGPTVDARQSVALAKPVSGFTPVLATRG